MQNIATAALVLCASAGSASAQFSLSNYQLSSSHALPSAASEASAVSFNRDTGTLFVLGDEGDAVVETSLTGNQLSVMSMTGFDDTEGLTYIGGGRFVVTEERLQDAYRFTYAAGGNIARGSLQTVDLGPTVGNVGIEGICFEQATGAYFTVKEKTPQALRSGGIDFDAGTNTLVDLFAPNLGVLDLSDIAVLSDVAALQGTPDAESLLVYSQESSMLLQVSRTGVVLSSFSFAGIADNAEGVTVGPDGTIYIVGENPTLYVLTPIPAPGAAGLIALSGLAAARRRRR